MPLSRRTKIICTLGPATSSLTELKKLIRSGMNIARLNMSHGDHESHADLIKKIKSLSIPTHPISIAMDTQGPAIRTGDVRQPIPIKKGQTFSFVIKAHCPLSSNCTSVSYDEFISDVSVGDIIVLDNGLLEMKVTKKTKTEVITKALQSGTIGSRRHINLPGRKVSLPPLTPKDKKDIAFAIKQKIDYINLSFVQNAKTIKTVRQMIQKSKGHTRIIAKIENLEAVKNLDSIIEAADGVMVARGDLGVEVPFEEVPILQHDIIQKCRSLAKPVIVATHLLESMITNPLPTRAEVTDISHAVFQQTDCIMLSGETSVGRFPDRCVQTMDRIARRVESEQGCYLLSTQEKTDLVNETSRSAISLACSLSASAILVFTQTGKTARLVSRNRPPLPIFAFTNNPLTARQLNLLWGTKPLSLDFSSNPETTVNQALKFLQEKRLLKKNQSVVIVSDILIGSTRVDSAIQVRKIT